MWKNERQESFRMSRDLANQELFFADFEARTRILEFIAQHKHPHQSNRQNCEPFSELKIN